MKELMYQPFTHIALNPVFFFSFYMDLSSCSLKSSLNSLTERLGETYFLHH